MTRFFKKISLQNFELFSLHTWGTIHASLKHVPFLTTISHCRSRAIFLRRNNNVFRLFSRQNFEFSSLQNLGTVMRRETRTLFRDDQAQQAASNIPPNFQVVLARPEHVKNKACNFFRLFVEMEFRKQCNLYQQLQTFFMDNGKDYSIYLFITYNIYNNSDAPFKYLSYFCTTNITNHMNHFSF